MKFFICLNIVLVLNVSLYSQSVSQKEIDKQLNDAALYFDSRDYLNAIKEYKVVLKTNRKNETANLNSLICKLRMNYQVDSVIEHTGYIKNAKLPEAMYYLGVVNHKLKKFDLAIDYFNKYKNTSEQRRKISDEETNRMIEICKNAKSEMSHPHRSIIYNMGKGINSPYPDYVPVIKSDERLMYFTSQREGSSSNMKDINGNYNEDVYVSYNKDGVWSSPQNVGAPINTDKHDACVALSPDGDRMIVYRASPDFLTGDLYVTRLTSDGVWSSPQKYGTEINSQFIETSAWFGNDTNEIYFSSNRPGGYGGKDIYRIKKLPNNKWGLPYNLGTEINTKYDEDDPYMHYDGVTLFFSSKGHNTIGEYDIFKTTLSAETNQFSKAESLGYPINTVNSDRFFVVSGDGKHGYYSSVKEDSKGSSDIYLIDTRFGDNDFLVKHGIVYKNDLEGKAKITLIDVETKQVAGIYNSNSKTGKFVLVLNPLKSYKIIAEEISCSTLTMDIEPMAFEKAETELIVKMTKK